MLTWILFLIFVHMLLRVKKSQCTIFVPTPGVLGRSPGIPNIGQKSISSNRAEISIIRKSVKRASFFIYKTLFKNEPIKSYASFREGPWFFILRTKVRSRCRKKWLCVNFVLKVFWWLLKLNICVLKNVSRVSGNFFDHLVINYSCIISWNYA